MSQHIRIIVLHGFRGTGKSTVGPLIAKNLGWHYEEMDSIIVKKAGKSIPELTKNGTEWQAFRQLEHDVLKELTQRKNVVISTGGGTCVNNIIKDGTDKTFGQINTELVQQSEEKGVLSLLLTASEEQIRERVEEHEMQKAESTRPILNPDRAKEIQKELTKYENNQLKQKEILVQAIVNDSMQMYEQRKPLYAAITEYVVDTTSDLPEESAQYVISIIKKHRVWPS